MRLSKDALKNTRINVGDSLFPVQDILLQTGQMVRYESGILSLDTVPLRVQRKIEQIVREELDAIDCQEVSLPVLQPREIWEQSHRWDKYVQDGTMYTVITEHGEYGLAPTAEEAMIKFVEQRISSYRSLPVTFYQFGTKFRNEIRSRGYLNRGKTFEMMDAYSFDVDEQSMATSYEAVRAAYFRICERLGLNAMAVAADNGAMGGGRSEEFMVEAQTGEDTIYFDETTGQGFNSELLERADADDYLATFGILDKEKLTEKRATEFGHIFQLGTKYSETMGILYSDPSDKKQPYYMGCYGIGVSRALGIIYENNAITENGKVVGVSLPPELSPYKLHIVVKQDSAARAAEAEEMYSKLTASGVQVIIDDTDSPVGVKIKNSRVMGVPYLAVFGDKSEAGTVEVEKTKTGEKQIFKIDELVGVVSEKAELF
jgi:prolyl-tRNA synthetase